MTSSFSRQGAWNLNDSLYRALQHRVIHSGEKLRYSVPASLFYNPLLHTQLSAFALLNFFIMEILITCVLAVSIKINAIGRNYSTGWNWPHSAEKVTYYILHHVNNCFNFEASCPKAPINWIPQWQRERDNTRRTRSDVKMCIICSVHMRS